MADKEVSRRAFIKASSVGVAGGLISPWLTVKSLTGAMRRGGMSGGRGVEIIDPSQGGLLIDPLDMPNLSTTPGLVEVELEAKIAPVAINGTWVNLLTYNGFYPAPTIRVHKGDLLRVYFKNSLPFTNETNILGFRQNITNLHTHGWHVSPSGNADNIFLHFEPGEEFEFEYDTSGQEAGTLSWYHPHTHGLVAEQLWGGLAGALVVEDESDVISDYETHTLVLKDISLNGSEPPPYTRSDYQNGKEGDIVMVNGQVNPVLPIKPGQVQRWRILNASTARYYKLNLENHTLYLVGTDGNLLDQPYPLDDILLTPGERIDVLVQADQSPGSYRFLSLPYNRGGNPLQRVTLMTIVYEGEFLSDSVPSSINPDARRFEIDLSILPRRRLTLQMRMHRGLINGRDFDVAPYVITSEVGTYELWEVVNMTMMDHPFHQHTNAAQILEITGGDSDYSSLYTSIPGWKDTINVPRMGNVLMLVPVRDFTGRTVFHCHIVEHEDIGMMGIWDLV
jgi:FtsP/CotA-like multicopper oxidase with cupredoxin domain